MCEVSAAATVPASVNLGRNVIIRDGCFIGENTVIGNNVIIYESVRLGKDCFVGDNAVLGKRPRLAVGSTARSLGDESMLAIGDNVTIGTAAVISAGSTIGNDCTVADQAFIRERVKLGTRVVVGRGVAIENDTTIGDGTRIQTGSYITAYMTIEENVFIAPMVVTTNDNYMGRTEKRFKEMRGATICKNARVGGGAKILPGIRIGEEAFIATGAVVTKDVPDGKLVMGVPARIIRDVNKDEFVDHTER